MRYNTELQNNNAELQAILDSVNGLPSAGGGEEEQYLSYTTRFEIHNLNIFKKKEVVLELYETTYLSSVFMQNQQTNETVEKMVLNCHKKITSCSGMFYATPNCEDYILKHITLNADISDSTNSSTMFAGMRRLEVIDGTPLNTINVTTFNVAFNKCESLKEVRFAPLSIKVAIAFVHCMSLSDDSIQSIIDGLADLTGQTTQTITFHATVKAKLTEEQISQITSKNWTLA